MDPTTRRLADGMIEVRVIADERVPAHSAVVVYAPPDGGHWRVLEQTPERRAMGAKSAGWARDGANKGEWLWIEVAPGTRTENGETIKCL